MYFMLIDLPTQFLLLCAKCYKNSTFTNNTVAIGIKLNKHSKWCKISNIINRESTKICLYGNPFPFPNGKIRQQFWPVFFVHRNSILSTYLFQVQRLLTVSTLGRSQKCLWWSWPVLSVLSVFTCISGLGIYAVYKDCDPLSDKKIASVSDWVNLNVSLWYAHK